jgi:hypothetical protein
MVASPPHTSPQVLFDSLHLSQSLFLSLLVSLIFLGWDKKKRTRKKKEKAGRKEKKRKEEQKNDKKGRA